MKVPLIRNGPVGVSFIERVVCSASGSNSGRSSSVVFQKCSHGCFSLAGDCPKPTLFMAFVNDFDEELAAGFGGSNGLYVLSTLIVGSTAGVPKKESGKIKHTFTVEIERRRNIEFTQSESNSAFQDGINRFVFLKLDFCFGRMNVDIYLFRIDLQKQEIAWKRFPRKQLFKSRIHGVIKVSIPEKAVVDKEKLFTARFPGSFRFSYKSFNPNNVGTFSNRNQFIVVMFPEYIHNPFAHGAGK